MDLKRFLEMRDHAFETDNVEMIGRILPPLKEGPFSLLMAFHKARYECVSVSTAKRLESQRWLIDNGVKRVTGQYVVPGEPLPSKVQVKGW